MFALEWIGRKFNELEMLFQNIDRGGRERSRMQHHRKNRLMTRTNERSMDGWPYSNAVIVSQSFVRSFNVPPSTVVVVWFQRPEMI